MFRMTTQRKNVANWLVDKGLITVLGFLSAMTLNNVQELQKAVARIEGARDAQHVIDEAQNRRIDWIYENR